MIAQVDLQTVEIPEDLLWALDADIRAHVVFESFSEAHQRELVAWIESARRAETRYERIQRALSLMTVEEQQAS